MTTQAIQPARNKRTPVTWRGHRVPGLFTRTLADGRRVFEAQWKSDGRVRSQVLETAPPNVTDARNELHALRAGSKPATGSGPTLADLADEYFADQQARTKLPEHDRRRRSLGTLEVGRDRFERYVRPKLGKRQVGTLTTLDVAALVRSWGSTLAPATQTGTLAVLSGVLSYGQRQGIVTTNPVRDLHRDDRPGTERTKQPRYLTQRDAEAVLRRMSNAYRPVAALMYYTGMRVSEALGLRWSDLDLDAGTITVTQQLGRDGKLAPLKTKSARRTLGLPAPVVRELLAVRKRAEARKVVRLDRAGLIFPAGNRHNAARAVRRAADTAGLNEDADVKPVGPHDLRHSFAYHCLVTLGLAVTQVSPMLGHSKVTTTLDVYGGLTDSGAAGARDVLVASFGS